MKKILLKFKNFTELISKFIFKSPARMSALGFIILILTGTTLLMLPVSLNNGSLSFSDALFTATSAACVTGLSVIDIGTLLSPFGQGVLLALIQVGGLGIMTISTLIILVAGGRTSIAERNIIKDTYTHSGTRSPKSILRNVIFYTLIIELTGAFILFYRFLITEPWHRAAYLSLFHSVSAFCNAGFSLFTGSLTGYGEDWILNLTISLLIISGGLGFLVISELKNSFPRNKRSWTRLSLHTKLVLTTTVVLLVSGTVFMVVAEWSNTLSGFSIPGKFLAGFFQSVSFRTAGFNTVSIGGLANETLFIVMLLMFVGAGPGSCAGGIKTTTLATLALLGYSRLRGKENPEAFGRTIPHQSVSRATSIVMMSFFAIAAGTILLLMTELGDTSHLASRGKFIEILFEAVSAFGTVGLSMGVTGVLTTAGKIIITAMMFIGRLGPMLIAVAISRQSFSNFRYAEENIMVG